MTTPAGREAGGRSRSGGQPDPIVPPRDDVGTQLRRRHDASLRCEPLNDGRRDPWVRRRKQAPDLMVEKITRHTAEVRGVGVYPALMAASVPKMYAHERMTRRPSCWTIPLWAVPAVVDAARQLGGVALIAEPQLVMFE